MVWIGIVHLGLHRRRRRHPQSAARRRMELVKIRSHARLHGRRLRHHHRSPADEHEQQLFLVGLRRRLGRGSQPHGLLHHLGAPLEVSQQPTEITETARPLPAKLAPSPRATQFFRLTVPPSLRQSSFIATTGDKYGHRRSCAHFKKHIAYPRRLARARRPHPLSRLARQPQGSHGRRLRHRPFSVCA